jgi:hypothetical protein
MKDKEKQIEEMAKEIGKSYTAYKGFCPRKLNVCSSIKNCMYCNIATNLIEQGYRKINENEVVISKEEFEALDRARKEVEKLSNQYPFSRVIDGFNSIIYSCDFENYFNLIDDIAKSEVQKARKETAEKFAKLIEFHSISKRDESGYETFTISNLCLREILREEFGFTSEEIETMWGIKE